MCGLSKHKINVVYYVVQRADLSFVRALSLRPTLQAIVFVLENCSGHCEINLIVVRLKSAVVCFHFQTAFSSACPISLALSNHSALLHILKLTLVDERERERGRV